MKIFFIDESGDHNLSTIDPQYPLFILGGIIAEYDYAFKEMEIEVQQFKLELFNNPKIILHTADISRNKNGFERVKEKEFRQLFFSKINHLMQNLDYKVVACVINKEEHLKQYSNKALDPYLLSLDILVERFCFEVAKEKGIIVAEKRNEILDKMLLFAWENIRARGTHFVKKESIRKAISEFSLKSKSENIAGLQLADLVLSPLGRFVLNKPVKDDFKIIESKLRQNKKGEYWGSGLIILPKPKKEN